MSDKNNFEYDECNEHWMSERLKDRLEEVRIMNKSAHRLADMAILVSLISLAISASVLFFGCSRECPFGDNSEIDGGKQDAGIDTSSSTETSTDTATENTDTDTETSSSTETSSNTETSSDTDTEIPPDTDTSSSTESDTHTDTGGTGCKGVPHEGFCWFLGTLGGSCGEICFVNGLMFDVDGTRDYAGSGGTVENCGAVLDAMKENGIDTWAGIPTSKSCNHGSGCAFAPDDSQYGPRLRCYTPATDETSKHETYYRVCACKEVRFGYMS